MAPPAVELQRYDQAFPNRSVSPTVPQQYPAPAYQIFQPQAQRAGYTHVLRDEADVEALVQGGAPPGYVEPVDEMVR